MSKKDSTTLSVILDIFVGLFVTAIAIRAYLGYNNRYFFVLSIAAAFSGVIALALALHKAYEDSRGVSNSDDSTHNSTPAS
jgi:tellurite resistance protein TehA-like permease